MWVRKIKRKNYVYGMKPYGWIKGSVLTFFGILLTRWDIGQGRVTFNIYFGLPIYCLIASSVMIVSLILKIEDNERGKRAIKKLEISSAILYCLAFGTAIYHTIYYNLDVLNLFLLALIGVALVLSIYYGKDWNGKDLLANVLISAGISLGIIYGAAINSFMIPILIYVFFSAIFFLQLSKDLINESKNEERYKDAGASSLALKLGMTKALNFSIYLDIGVIILIILPIIPNFLYIPSELFYMISMIVTVIILGIAVILTFLMKSGKVYYKIVKLMLKISVFFVFAILLFASF